MIILASSISALGVSGIAMVTNHLLAKQKGDLASWAGWVSAFIIRLLSFILLAISQSVIVTNYPSLRESMQGGIIAFSSIFMLGMLFDTFLSLKARKQSEISTGAHL